MVAEQERRGRQRAEADLLLSQEQFDAALEQQGAEYQQRLEESDQRRLAAERKAARRGRKHAEAERDRDLERQEVARLKELLKDATCRKCRESLFDPSTRSGGFLLD